MCVKLLLGDLNPSLYYQEVWMEAFNLASVPATLEWRKAENIFYLADIREVLVALPPPTAPAPTSPEQLPPKPLFLLLKFLKGLARLMTKVRRLRWLRIRARARR